MGCKNYHHIATKYVPHSEYSFKCELIAEVPILVVLLLKDEKVLQFQKFGRSSASPNIQIRLSFFPYDWHNSNDVQINLYQKVNSQGNGLRTTVNSESLKQDPRHLVETNAFSSGVIEIGKFIDLAVIWLEQPRVAQFLIVPLSETESTHGRWRLKKGNVAELPAHLSFLVQGRLTGKIPFSASS
jgi:hypothetical protein